MEGNVMMGGPQREGVRSPDGDDRPGDPACWLGRVCPECGSVADSDPPTTCPVCHADMPAD
jgi:rubrerythrin